MIPLSPLLNYFSECSVYTWHVKYACKHTHKRQRAGVEKKKVSLSKLVYLFHEMGTQKKRKKESQQQTAATVCRHYRLGDNTRTFCFALLAFPFYPNGWSEREKNSAQEHQRGEQVFGMLWGTCEWPYRKIWTSAAFFGCEFYNGLG